MKLPAAELRGILMIKDNCYYVVSSPIRLKILGLLRKTRKIHIGNVFNWLKD